MRHLGRVSWIALWASLALLPAVFPGVVRARDSRKRWKDIDHAGERALLAHDYRRADRKLSRLFDEMVERLGPGPGGREVLGIVLMHRALAEAGLGRREDAIWDWHVALNFNPSLVTEDLGRFGEAGSLLAENPLRGPPPMLLADGEAVSVHASPPGKVTPPRVRQTTRPDFPFGTRFFGVRGRVVVETIITKDGHVIQPRVLEGLDKPTLVYSALEALRKWAIRPARLNGKPVAVYYILTVHFE